MPNRDGTGPEGKGPRTGRKMGKCAPQEGEAETLRPGRRGRCGCGRGRRFNG